MVEWRHLPGLSPYTETLAAMRGAGKKVLMLSNVPRRVAPVREMLAHFEQARREDRFFWLALSPEGTRGRTEGWRSGFYQVALGAGVLIFLYWTRSRLKPLLIRLIDELCPNFALCTGQTEIYPMTAMFRCWLWTQARPSSTVSGRCVASGAKSNWPAL